MLWTEATTSDQRETMPAKISSETPLPMPLESIWLPIQVTSMSASGEAQHDDDGSEYTTKAIGVLQSAHAADHEVVHRSSRTSAIPAPT